MLELVDIDKNKDFVFGLSDIKIVIAFLKQKLGKCRVFAFYGPLGVGKTTIIRALLESCEVHGPITSPTFTYLNCYKNSHGLKFYHFDLYRFNNLDEFLGAGFGEYLDDPEGILFIEWPEVIESVLPSGSCKVKLDYNSRVDSSVHSNAKKRVLNIEIVD